MFIRKKRIRSLSSNVRGVKHGEKIIISVRCEDKHKKALLVGGFTEQLEVGEKVLPTPIGARSRFNANGEYVPDKTKPMETAYRQAEWTWQEFRGRYDSEERSKIVDIPYQRYPRVFYEPPSIEFEIAHDSDGNKRVVSPQFVYDAEDKALLHTINLFLEYFGECELLNDELEAVFHAPFKKLNWEILPKGKRPWHKLEPLLRPVISRQSEGNQIVINKRLATINEYEPEFVAVGKAGFSGYLIFGFPSLNIFVLESTEVNNATYVLDKNWEEISGLTKAEILREDLHKDRVIHRESWFKNICGLLKTK